MTDIAGNITFLKSKIPGSVKLIAVSKMMPASDILTAYNAGHRFFGENRVQEILKKKDLLPSDIEWHLIGHLQSNKVKSVIPFISLIHSIDSFKLLSVVNEEALKVNRLVDCLLQIHIASEETKFGFSLNELTELPENKCLNSLDNVRICGVMGMATFTKDKEQIRKEFARLYQCYAVLKKRYFTGKPYFKEISMGMSGDYEIALEEGSTILRIGSLIFGDRNKVY